MPPSTQSRLVSLREALSFSAKVRELVDTLNWEIASPEKVRSRLHSHPSGFTREVAKRRLTIAEAYLRLLHTGGVDAWQERLDTLRGLIHQAWHSKTLSMPINTARVQIALMKQCVENRGKKRTQLERMSDFTLASYGREAVIRRLLRELDMVEVPEDGRPLREMGLGWDDHVHDLLTEGRKTPCVLLLDAFIAGMSRLTVVYSDLSDMRLAEEAIEAGRILGIQVDVGVEFSVGPRGSRLHFMYLPPGSDSIGSLRAVARQNESLLAPFFEGLTRNASARRATVSSLLDRFNDTHLKEINARFCNLPFLQVRPLRWEDLEHLLHGGHASRIHVGKLLEETIKPVLHKRVLYLKNQYRHAQERVRHGDRSTWEEENLKAQYLEARKAFEACSAESLTEAYMPSTEQADYDSSFRDPAEVLPLLAASGGRVVFIHPLSRGVEPCIRVLFAHHESIHEVETFNLADAMIRDPADLRRLNALVGFLNAGNVDAVARQVADWGVPVPERAVLERVCRWYAEHTLRPRCASDYIGRDARATGMGFVGSPGLRRRDLQTLARRGHPVLSGPVGRLILQEGRPEANLPDDARVFVLGSIAPRPPNRVGDEVEVHRTGVLRFWRHLNPDLKVLLKLSVAFLPATLVVGPWYTLLWFAITGTRNAIVDLMAAAGYAVRSWRVEAVDRDNLANSLFYTGFSVPIMAAAKLGFETGWAALGLGTGFLYTVVKFLVIALANGTYITTHNRLRGFERNVVRGNFFRTVLSWPLATACSLLLGPLNDVVPAIVQSKFWSDVVGGFIEGTGKILSRRRLCQRDYLELLEAFAHGDRQTRQVAMADILYVWARRYQGRSALRNLFKGRFKLGTRAAVTVTVPMAPEELERAFEDLVRSFSTEGGVEALTSLILLHYAGREAVVLTSLIADHYDDFLAWLDTNRPRTVGADGVPPGLPSRRPTHPEEQSGE